MSLNEFLMMKNRFMEKFLLFFIVICCRLWCYVWYKERKEMFVIEFEWHARLLLLLLYDIMKWMLINKNENKSYENLLLHRVCVGAFMAIRGWEIEWEMTDEDTKIFFMWNLRKEFFLWKFFCHRFSRIWDVNDMNEMERKWHWRIFDVGCLMAFEWNV